MPRAPPLPPPSPTPPWAPRAARVAPIDFQARDGLLYADGTPFFVKGVTWFGSENRAAPPLGLDKHPMAWYYDFLREHDFNAVRFLFNHQMILDGARLDPPNTAIYGLDAPWESPELAHLGYLEAFVRLAEAAAEQGVLVMMGCHRLRPSAWPGDGLWYDAQMAEAAVLRSWELIAKALCDQWNVFMVDLVNEPWQASWGFDEHAKDWGEAATRIGNHVLSLCPRWLIMVEGVGVNGAKGSVGAEWWGVCDRRSNSGPRHRLLLLCERPALDPRLESRKTWRACTHTQSRSACRIDSCMAPTPTAPARLSSRTSQQPTFRRIWAWSGASALLLCRRRRVPQSSLVKRGASTRAATRSSRTGPLAT